MSMCAFLSFAVCEYFEDVVSDNMVFVRYAVYLADPNQFMLNKYKSKWIVQFTNYNLFSKHHIFGTLF